MIYRSFGKTGLNVSLLSFGAAPLGNEYGVINHKEGQRAVHCAIDNGINYFDVAPFYGRTLAEQRLGTALKGKRQNIILGTKAGRHDEDPATGFDFSAGAIARSLEASLKRLQTDYVDILLAHDIEFAPAELIIGETIPAMRRLQEAGKVRFLGITAYPLHILARIIRATDIDIVLSYCRYNLFDRSMDDVLTPVTKELAMGLINASPLHMGMLTDRVVPDWHPAPRRVVEVGKRVAEYCRSQETSISKIALQFALNHPHVSTTLVGMSTCQEVEANVEAVGTMPDPHHLAEIEVMIKPVANLWWKEGLPENHDPGSVDQRS